MLLPIQGKSVSGTDRQTKERTPVFRPKPPCFSENGPQLTYAAVFFSGAPVTKNCITQVHMAHMRIPVIIITAETFMTRLLPIKFPI